MKDELRYRIEGLVERLLRLRVGRALFLAASILGAWRARRRGDAFAEADQTLRYPRIVGAVRPVVGPPDWFGRRVHALLRESVESSGPNALLRSYAESPEARSYRREFCGYGMEYARGLKYPRQNDSIEREGDLLLLKPAVSPAERGVVLVQYNDSLKKFAALFDLGALAERFHFVLEPSTWGYQEAAFLMFAGLPNRVFVQAQYLPDYEFIERLGGNLVPVRLGAGDWVDPDLFDHDPAAEKIYDVIMVASWLSLKRHRTLFAALGQIEHVIRKVAVVGYPLAGRTLDDIRREAAAAGVAGKVDFIESVPPSRVRRLLQQSRVSVMLSKREGASRVVYESLFCNTPVIVTRDNVGINRDHINASTGMFADDRSLASAVRGVIEGRHAFEPRAWAERNTGYRNSTAFLNGCVRESARATGEHWSKDIFFKKNVPNATYARVDEHVEAHAHVGELEQYIRCGRDGTA